MLGDIIKNAFSLTSNLAHDSPEILLVSTQR